MLTLLYSFVEFEKLHLGVFENMFEANNDSECHKFIEHWTNRSTVVVA